MNINIIRVDGNFAEVKPAKYLGEKFGEFRTVCRRWDAKFHPQKRVNMCPINNVRDLIHDLTNSGFLVKEIVPTPRREALTEEERYAAKGIVYVAGMDPDRARELNNVGFSGVDGDFGHKMAEVAKRGMATEKQWTHILRLAHKYRRQIKESIVQEITQGNLPLAQSETGTCPDGCCGNGR